MQSELRGPPAAFLKGLLQITAEFPVVHFSKVTVAVHECQLHAGIGNPGLQCEAVVFPANLAGTGFEGKCVVKAGESVLHVWIPIVCEFLDSVNVLVELDNVVLHVCDAEKYFLAVAVCHHTLGCCPECLGGFVCAVQFLKIGLHGSLKLR